MPCQRFLGNGLCPCSFAPKKYKKENASPDSQNGRKTAGGEAVSWAEMLGDERSEKGRQHRSNEEILEEVAGDAAGDITCPNMIVSIMLSSKSDSETAENKHTGSIQSWTAQLSNICCLFDLISMSISVSVGAWYAEPQ